ncbi:MAG: aminotransferase class I/II-fold pyridoxal phosphate-dependent enzyme [Candidatus Lutacidiplasmatales archaeon]
MSFPLGEWIDSHADCRHNLAKSGMYGAIPAPVPSSADLRRADEADLRARLSADVGVDPRRVFLATGASEANAEVILFLARLRRGRGRRQVRVCPPEYPPFVDVARWAGFRPTNDPRPTELALISQPRNPEGDVWDRSRFLEWSSGAEWVLVDETFREFAGTRSFLEVDHPGLFATGSFTKFFAGDDLRVGFVVVPERVVTDFARFHGLVTNTLAPYSVAGATRALRDREPTRRRVRRILEANVAAAQVAFPKLRVPRAPVLFDRPESGEDGDSLARRALGGSVLVCSGSFFGDPAGVRLCLTRPSFPADLAAYLRVRNRFASGSGMSKKTKFVSVRAARRRPAGSGRGKASPS